MKNETAGGKRYSKMCILFVSTVITQNFGYCHTIQVSNISNKTYLWYHNHKTNKKMAQNIYTAPQTTYNILVQQHGHRTEISFKFMEKCVCCFNIGIITIILTILLNLFEFNSLLFIIHLRNISTHSSKPN